MCAQCFWTLNRKLETCLFIPVTPCMLSKNEGVPGSQHNDWTWGVNTDGHLIHCISVNFVNCWSNISLFPPVLDHALDLVKPLSLILNRIHQQFVFWQIDNFWRVQASYFVDCFSDSWFGFVWCFLVVTSRFWHFGRVGDVSHSVHDIRRHLMSICPNISDVHLGHLVEVVFAWCLHCKFIIFLLKINN